MTSASPTALVGPARRRYRPRYLLLLFLVAFAWSVTGAEAALATASGPSFALQALQTPNGMSYFVYHARPTTVLSGRVRVANAGGAAGDVALYAVDATTGQTSGTVYLDGRAPRSAVGSWIVLGAKRLTLSPGESRIVPFTVTVPAGVVPGQHVGGIVAENLLPSATPLPTPAGGGGGTLIVKFRTLDIVAVEVDVPGHLKAGVKISGVTAGGTQGHQTLQIGMSNSGNVIVKPQGTMDVADADGRRVQHLTFTMDSFLPWTAIDYPVPVRGHALGAGSYEATIVLTYGDGQTVRYHGTFEISQQQVDAVFQGESAALPAPPGSHGSMIMIAVGLAGALFLGSMTGVMAARRRRAA